MLNPPLIYTLTPGVTRIDTTSYSDLQCDFIFDYNTVTALHSVKIIGNLESGTSYTIRVYDATNRTVLGTGTFSNLNTINFGSDFVLTSDAIIEFHCKCAINSIANIASVVVYYN